MEGRLVLKDCAIFHADGRVQPRMAVVVADGQILKTADDREVPVLPGDWEVRCRGRILSAGLVDCHCHLANAQLLPPSGELLMRAPKARADLQRRRRRQERSAPTVAIVERQPTCQRLIQVARLFAFEERPIP